MPLALARLQVGQSSVAARCTEGMLVARSLYHVPNLSPQQLPLQSHLDTTLLRNHLQLSHQKYVVQTAYANDRINIH